MILLSPRSNRLCCFACFVSQAQDWQLLEKGDIGDDNDDGDDDDDTQWKVSFSLAGAVRSEGISHVVSIVVDSLMPQTNPLFLCSNRNSELELIQTHMVQKPVLRVEGGKSACVLGVLV